MSPAYDPFGRPVENHSSATPSPTGSADPAGDAPAGGPPDRRTSFVVAIAVVVVVAIGGLLLLMLASGGPDAPNHPSAGSDAQRHDPGPGPSPADGDDEAAGGTDDAEHGPDGEPAPSGDTPGARTAISPLHPSGTGPAIARLRAELRPGDRIETLRLWPDRLTADVTRGRDQPLRELTVRDGDVVEERSDGRTSSRPGFPPRAIDPAAPRRLIAAALRGLAPETTADVQYVALSVGFHADHSPEWAVYLDEVPNDDARWQGDVRGRHVVRSSDGAPAPPPGRRGRPTTPVGARGSSLIRRDRLRRVIAAVAAVARPGELVMRVVVRPTRAEVTTRRGYRERTYAVDGAIGVALSRTGETSERGGLRFSQVIGAAPERALAAIGRRTGSDARRRVDYVILSARDPAMLTSRTAWNVYLGGGNPRTRFWRSSLDGRQVGQPGDPGAP